MNQWNAAPAENTLHDNEVHIWLFHLNIGQPRIKHFYPLLSLEEKERSERLVDFRHRKRFIAAHGFMREALATYLPYTADQLEFTKTEMGKPQLKTTPDDEQIQFNLTHSENIAMLAVIKRHPIGIDVEYTKRKTDWVKIIHRYFTAGEQEKFHSLTEADRKQAFFQVWTRKEALMKVTGRGLRLSPTKFTVTVPPEAARFCGYLDDNTKENWFMEDIELPGVFGEYCGCYSTDSKPDEVSYFIFG